MPEMFSYIFSSMETTERTLRLHRAIDFNLTICALAAAAALFTQAKRIEALEDRVDVLNQKIRSESVSE